MEKTLIELIKEFRKGDDNTFLLIAERFNPVILKYVRLLYKDEREDTISELMLSLLEAIHKIKYMNNEGQCHTFLNNALKNRFLELYKKSRKKFDTEQYWDTDYDYCSTYNEYGDTELKADLKRYLSGYNDKQKKILISIFIDGKSNTETASENMVSRQYTNRLKNKLCQEMRDAYIA